MKADRDFYWRLAATVWGVAVIGYYFLMLGEWVLPPNGTKYITWGLPFLRSAVAPDIGLFARSVSALTLAVTGFAAAGLGIGYSLGGFLRVAGDGTKAGRSIPVGLAGAGFMFLGLGLTGLMHPAPIGVAGGLAILAGVRRLRMPHPERLKDFSGLFRGVLFALPAGLILWMGLLVAVAPESFQDAMRYHLFLPGRFVLEHKFIFVDSYFFWSYMGVAHMLYAPAIALGGELGAKGVNLLFGILSFAAMIRIMGRAGLGGDDRKLALALAVTAPGIMLVSGSVFIEHATALYVLLALEGALPGGSRMRRRVREAFLMVMIGFSVKYTAVIGAGGCAAMILAGGEAARWRNAAGKVWRGLLALAAATTIPWCAVRWLWTGDPLSPLLARMGADTMDSPSSFALFEFYRFARDAIEGWLTSPAEILRFPVIFAGAHGGYWEHPGPAIPALLATAILFCGRASGPVKSLLLFSAGSAGAWMVICGGVSPHYIIALTGIWTAACVGVLKFLPAPGMSVLRNALFVVVFFQALISMVAVMVRWAPRDVAFGMVSRDYYLTHGMEPVRVHYPIRKEIEERFPGRGNVYVYGDDTSYYLSGRVFCDYEMGDAPLLWRMAAESNGPGHLRRKLRQRNWTHLLYSTRWPDVLGEENRLRFRYDRRTVDLVQEFWRLHARLVVKRELTVKGRYKGSFVFGVSDDPAPGGFDPDATDRRPFLPGAEALVWEGDAAVKRGALEEARVAYRRRLAEYPSCGALNLRMAEVAIRSGDRASAAESLRRAERIGWGSRRLRKMMAAGERRGADWRIRRF